MAATLLAALLGPSAPTGRVAAQDEPPRVDAPDAPVQATCAPAETCAAITETDTTSTGWLAAPRQAAGPLGQGTGGAGPGDELASCSAVPALASALLRTRVDAGLLGARQSAVATLAPNAVALSRLAARLRSGEAVDASDPLVWLLTQQEAPRYPNNPFVTLTRDLRPGVQGDASYESLLAARIAATDTMLRPQDLLRLALDVAGGDYPLGTLIAHNLLKELAFASSAGGGALVAWSPTDRGSPDDARAAASPTYIVLSGDDVQALTGKLAPLRPADDPHPEDQQGPWYRLFGSLFVGALAGGSTAAASAGDALARWFRPDPSDPFLDQLTACGVQLAPLMAELSIADAAPDPALASPFAAPGALTSAPSDVGVSSPPFTAPASPAAPSSGRGAAIAAPPPAPSAPAVNLAAGAPVSYPPPVPYQPASVQPQVPPTVIPSPAEVPGIRGVVRSAQTGQPLTGATVSAPSVGRSVTTDGVGSYQLTGLAPGAVQVRATASGFIADSVTVTVPPSGSVTQNFGLSPSLAAGQFRIVLTWATSPSDLDAVLYLPGGAGARPVLDYHNRSVGGATLDTDDRAGSGPETITISQVTPGQYTYAVHQYSNDGSLPESRARVRILHGDSEVQGFTVPPGSGRWWTVFTIDGVSGTVTPVNTLSSQPPAH